MNSKINPEEYNERIKSYLNKLMKPEEVEKFEVEMKNNPDLAKEVKAQQFERAFNHLTIRAELREIRAELEKEEGKPTVKSRPMWISFVRNPYVRTLAASIVIALTGIGIWMTLKDNTEQTGDNRDSLKLSPEVSEKINELARLSKQPREQAVPQELNEAVLAYDRVDFDDTLSMKKTARLFEKPKVNDSKSNDSTLYGTNPNSKPNKPDSRTETYRLLYQGLISLYTGEYEKSINKFNQVRGPLEDEARFYKALAYLKNNETKKGRESLKEIIRSSKTESVRNQAQELSVLLDEKK